MERENSVSKVGWGGVEGDNSDRPAKACPPPPLSFSHFPVFPLLSHKKD